MEDFDHLKIKMEEIIMATDNFDPNKLIGRGGFGPVYKGQLSLPMGPTMLAFKRLDRRLGQGITEFWKEVMMLSKYKHENLISLLHFSIKGDEMVLGYQYASRGSLDRYLSDASFTWNQRLQICIGAARALKYLHDPVKTQQRIIHRDIKSANILLDEKWTAKVSDFGLSKFAPANLPHTFLVSNAVGTPGYCDPLYWETGLLTKESDVYSFGVVLFEVMCGRPCCEYRKGELIGILVHKWKDCCDEKKLDAIIFQDLKRQIEWDSLITFSAIARRCLNRDNRERPTMDEIVKELEIALEQQENIIQYNELVKISKLAVPPLSYRSLKELIPLLSKGILVHKGKRWLSINKNEEIQELISATHCVHGGVLTLATDVNSRFSNVLTTTTPDFKVEVKTQFLSPHVTYAINLVFKIESKNYGLDASFIYKQEEETYYSKPSIVQMKEGGWLMTELYQFTSYQKEHNFKIEFSQSGRAHNRHYIEGIEFRPIEYEIRDNSEDKDMQHISGSDEDWEKEFSPDYMDLIKLSKENVKWTTKKELYFLLRKGFLIDNCKKWISVSKNMKKRLMIPAKEFLEVEKWIWKSLPESRFEQVAESLNTHGLNIRFQIKSEFLSIGTTYSCRLIYKLPRNYTWLEGPITRRSIGASIHTRFLYLVPPIPTPIIRFKVDENYDIPSHTHKIKGHPKLRKDGWMELPLCEVTTNATKTIGMYFTILVSKNKQFAGLVIQGIEFRRV